MCDAYTFNDKAPSNHNHDNSYIRVGSASVDNIMTIDLNSFYSGITLATPSCSNLPSNDWFLVIAAGGTGTSVQVCFGLFADTGYRRSCAANVWSNWDYINRTRFIYTDSGSSLINVEAASKVLRVFNPDYVGHVVIV